ncbi:hypothetical protein Dimus_028302 [Dionaea muscipula]
MPFWGVEVKPGKPIYLCYEDVDGKLFLTQATLGIGKSTEKSILQCKVGDGNPIFLCTLLPDKFECCPLHLEFEERDDVKFSVIGPTSIHLSGVVQGVNEEDDQDGYDSDAFEEDVYGTNSEGSICSDSEDDYNDDLFGDDDDDMYLSSPARRNSGVVIEEIEDDGNPTSGNVKIKEGKSKKAQILGSENKAESRQIVPKESAATLMLESEDEDGFPVSLSQQSKPDSQKLDANSDAKVPNKKPEKKKKKKKADLMKDDDPRVKSLKRKADPVVDENSKSESIPVNGSSLPSEVVHEDSIKQQKKRKKKKKDDGTVDKAKENDTVDKGKSDIKEDQIAHDPDSIIGNDSHAVNGNASTGLKKKKKKERKNGKNQDVEGAENDGGNITSPSEKSTSNIEGSKKSKARQSKVREYSNGLVIEELEMGKPDGNRASLGKKVKVHYIGKLKKNDQIFDSNIDRAPFQFRLGVGAVIKGWDVGVEGMRVGDKRRLIIPPEMGYGAKGASPKIPPNSWLVFDVQLVDVS